MKMAELRRKELREWGVQEDRISIIVNRWQKNETSMPEMEQFIGQPIAGKIPNDYRNVRSATIEGRPVAANTALGKTFTSFAGQLCGDNRKQGVASWIKDLRTFCKRRPNGGRPASST